MQEYAMQAPSCSSVITMLLSLSKDLILWENDFFQILFSFVYVQRQLVKSTKVCHCKGTQKINHSSKS